MQKIVFTIEGNQDEQKGNPIPYFRTTAGSQWTDGAMRYNNWKGFVRRKFLDHIQENGDKTLYDTFNFSMFKKGNPIPAQKEKQMMSLKIVWANRAHGDCDNIFKGIADSLFVNDKYLASGGFDYEYSKDGKGSVEITLMI